jgi:predicted RNase H-like HicB family nuclease
VKYAVVIERAGANYSAYVPDLPGCVATGRTIAAVQRRLQAAMRVHIAGMREDGTPCAAPAGQGRLRFHAGRETQGGLRPSSSGSAIRLDGDRSHRTNPYRSPHFFPYSYTPRPVLSPRRPAATSCLSSGHGR